MTPIFKFATGALMVACILLAGPALAAAPPDMQSAATPAETALVELQARLAPLRALQARFAQTVRDDTGAVLQKAEGTMSVARGNRLRWQIDSPYEYLVVTDGETLWRHDADLEQAMREPFAGELASTPALIFSGNVDQIGRHYAVSRPAAKHGDVFRLTPQQRDPLFKSLELRFAKGVVAGLALVDNLDQRTEIRFSDVVVNPSLAPSLFQFVPPPGTEVVTDGP